MTLTPIPRVGFKPTELGFIGGHYPVPSVNVFKRHNITYNVGIATKVDIIESPNIQRPIF
jgi:hypothetical protein